ncbi:MAG: VCBS repeat-containing protein [Deltaproteobacteria bacterium]|nr:VCBS repeat-containing protein [Deltaproteobacteria bacterium]
MTGSDLRPVPRGPWLLALAAMATVALACHGTPLADSSLSVDMAIEKVVPRLVPTRGGTEITLIGRNFKPGTTVHLDNLVLPTLLHDVTRLTFFAPPRDVGTIDLAVFSPSGQKMRVRPGLTYYAERIDFARETRLLDSKSVSGIIEQFLLGDLTGDGRADVVAKIYAKDSGQRFLRTFLAIEDGLALAPRFLAPFPAGEEFVLLADVNHDKKADLVTSKSLYLANPRDEFDPPIVLAQPGDDVVAAVMGDFDGNGREDLGYFSGAARGLTTVEVEGTEVRLSCDCHRVRLGRSPRPDRGWPLARDLTDDGRTDLVYEGDDLLLHVRRGPKLDEGDAWVSPQAGKRVDDFTLVLANDDGIPDLVASFEGEDHVLVYLGAQGGSFEAPHLGDTFCGAGVVPLDHFVDQGASPFFTHGLMMAACASPPSLQVIKWSGGVAHRRAIYASPLAARQELGQLDGILGSDLVTLVEEREGQVLMARYNTDLDEEASFAPHGAMAVPEPSQLVGSSSGPSSGTDPTPVAFGQKGLVASAWRDWVAVMGAEKGRLQARSRLRLSLLPGAHVKDLAACDLDQDGDDDLVALISPQGDDPVRLVLVHADGDKLISREEIVLGRTTFDTRIAALRVEAASGCDILWFWLDAESPTGFAGYAWSASSPASPLVPLNADPCEGGAATKLGVQDLDGDGRTDLFGPSGGKLLTWLSSGDGRFTCTARVLFADPSWRDLDVTAAPRHGGGLDLGVVAWRDAPQLALFSMSADGELSDPWVTPLLGEIDPFGVRLGDVNGDGHADAMVPGYTDRGAELVVALGAESGPFQSEPIGLAEEYLGYDRLDMADLDGDGLADLVYTRRTAPGRVFFAQNQSK